MDEMDLINPEAAKRSKSSNLERTNEFLAKIAIMRSLPPHARFPIMVDTFRELIIRISKLEFRIKELEDKL